MRIWNSDNSTYARLGKIAAVGALCIACTWALIEAISLAATLGVFQLLGQFALQLVSIAFVAGTIAMFAHVAIQFRKTFSIHNGQSKKQKELRRIRRAAAAKVKHQQSLRAQLTKPDFETRLENFTREKIVDEPFVSKAKFWQLDTEYQKDSPRSVSFFRILLMRISKYVNKSKMS